MSTAWQTINFVSSLRSLFLKARFVSFSKPGQDAPILCSISFSAVQLLDSRLPRYGKWSTCSRGVSKIVTLKCGKAVFGAGWAMTFVSLMFTVRPKRLYAVVKLLTDCWSSWLEWQGAVLPSEYWSSKTSRAEVSRWDWSLVMVNSPPLSGIWYRLQDYLQEVQTASQLDTGRRA